MLFVERNQEGSIVALRTGASGPGQEPVSLLNQEVLRFLESSCELDALAQLFSLSDTTIVRVLEDLVDLLIDKKLILFTELPPAAQTKLQNRKRLRQQLEASQLMVDDIL